MEKQSLDTKILAGVLILYSASTLSSMAGMEIFGWTAAFGAILMLVFKRRPFSIIETSVRLPVDFALLGLAIIVVLGAVFKTPDGISKLDVVGSARWILLFAFLRSALIFTWSDRIARRTFLVLLGFVTIVSVYAIWQYFYGIDIIRGARHVLEPTDFRNGQPIFRAEGLFGSSMTFGNSIALSWCFAVAWVLHGRMQGWIYKLACASVVLGILAIFATMTRGVWLSAAAALVVMSVKSWRRGLVVTAIVGVLFAVISLKFLPELSGRLQSIADASNSSNSARVQVWRANFEIFKENPLLGVGYGVNEDVIDDYYPRLGIENGFHGHAHNTYLQFLSGTGIFGFLFFAAFTLYFLIISWRLARDFDHEAQTNPSLQSDSNWEWKKIFVEGALGAQIALIVGGLTECNFKDAEVNHQFMFILAVLATLYSRSTNISSPLLIEKPN